MIGYRFSAIQQNLVSECFRFCLICSSWLNTIFGIGKIIVKFYFINVLYLKKKYRKHPANGLAKRDDNFNGIYAEIATCSVNSEKKLLPSNEMDL